MDRLNDSLSHYARRWLAVLTLACLAPVEALWAGGYVDGSVTLDPADAINTGTVSVSPTFNNDQFNDKLLVGTVNNDQIRTPSTVDPVSTVTGNNYHDETDFSIRGRNALNYVFTRTYNSQPISSTKLGDLGYGWVHSYGMKLVSNDFGQCPNCTPAQASENGNGKTSSVTYTDERGGEHLYLINETTHGVTSPAGEFEALSLNSNPGLGWHTLRFRNGINYIFETSGDLLNTPGVTARLKIIGNDFGDQLTLNYDGSGRLVSIQDNLNIVGRSSVGLSFRYYANDRLQDVTDWNGRKWQFTYDAAGNHLQSVTDPLNHTRSYTYTGNHLLHEVFQPLQRENQSVKTTFNYYQNGRVFNYYNALNQTETLDYDLYRKTTRVTDPRGGTRAYAYDANGRMTKLTEPDGGILLFENQGDAMRSKKYDALGYATTYSYRNDKAFAGTSDNFGNVTREQDALNQTVDTGYGPYDQVASVKDKNGSVTTTSFYTATAGCGLNGKPQAQAVSVLNGQSNVKLRDFCWNADGTLASLTEYLEPGNTGRERVTAFSYEAGSQGLNVSDIQVTGSGQTLHTHFSYDNLGRTLTQTQYRRSSPTDATLLALTTAYEYDALDRPIKVTDPEGRIQETVYDANGQIAQEKTWYPTNIAKAGCAAPATINGTSYVICTDASHQYDAADRRIATTDVLGHTSQFAYDPAGNLTKVTDANGHVAQYEYDAMNRKTATIDGNGHRTETRYNLRGEAIAVTNANGETTKSEYDEIGRLSKVVDALGFETQYRYDANGNLTCIIDANGLSNAGDPGHQPVNTDGCTESRQYDELNRLTQSKDAQNNIAAYSYDLFGNRTRITDAEGRITTFKYDDLGRVIEIVDPLVETPTDKTQTFAYDEAGNVIETTDRKGQTTQYAYDRLNRLRQADHLADSSQETYTYDIFGDLIQSQNADVTYTYTYSSKHQLQSKTDSRASKTLSWTYDPAGNIDTKTDYQGDITTYQYDSANRLVAETNPAYLQVSYHYDGAGRLIDRILSNGAITHYGWDAASRLTQLKNTTLTGGLVNDTGYTRDRLGNILSQIETNALGQATGTTNYSYDPEYRLKTADYPGTAFDESFSYDKVGNRKTHTLNGSTQYYTVDADNRLKDIRSGSPTGTIFESYGYDDNGSLTSISGNRSLTLTWDANNRVKQINSTQYRYDPKGYRIEKTGSLTNRYYLEGEHLEAVYDGNGALRDQYLRGSVIDEVVNGYHRDANNVMVNSSYHHDALQSVLGQSAHDGQIQSTQSYTAFGGNLSGTGTSNAAQKYTGREADGESGFYYYRARYYDPIRGGFISEDPLGFNAGINFYVYVGNNPINANDPTGEVVNIALGAAIGGISSVVGTYNSNPNATYADALQAFGTGALVGGFSAAVPIGGSFAASLARNALAGAGGNFTGQGLTGGINNIKYEQVVVQGVIGALSGAVGNVVQASQALNYLRAGFNYAEGVAFGEFGGTSAAITTGVGINSLVPTTYGGIAAPSIYGGITSLNGSANGGFLIYPNKSNTNQIQRVYKK